MCHNMATHITAQLAMKTTIEISDELLARSRRVATKEGITLRALVEDGLRLALKARSVGGPPRALNLPTFGGSGLLPEYCGPDGLHQAILDSYDDRS